MGCGIVDCWGARPQLLLGCTAYFKERNSPERAHGRLELSKHTEGKEGRTTAFCGDVEFKRVHARIEVENR
jgi:hypothetical protein